MNSFLQDIAKYVIDNYRNQLDEVTVIFPNRRAGLYFKEYLKQSLDGPVWSPKIMSFQDFVAYQSSTQIADKLMLTYRLFEIYNEALQAKESFDKFYYWGQMLLKDFDDVDKYLVNTENLYQNLSRQKQLDLTFDYLDEEQKAIIQKFWQGFDESKSAQKERFQFVWDRLYRVYTQFQKSLKAEGLAYEGMQYRHVAENIDKIQFKNLDGPIVFAGFNALNLAEENIISWLITHKNASIHWDVDAYYMNDINQEAGHFFREYKNKNAFASSFPNEYPNKIRDTDKNISLTGVPQHVGQAKILGQQLSKLLNQNPTIDLRTVAVVLADEALLFPVLLSLPEQIESINVTMGFPLTYAPVNSLIEHILELKQLYNKKKQVFNFKPILAILRHPLIIPHAPEKIKALIKDIEKENKVFIHAQEFKDIGILKMIFSPIEKNLVNYLTEILLSLHQSNNNDERAIEIEYLHYFYQILNRYGALLESMSQDIDVRSFSRLFKQLVSSERLPFTGEPIRGLQIMGVLETRNLDFEHVFVLSMNEDFFPSQGGKHSFIPYNLRKAYSLPNFDQQDAIYSYLFYRLLQRPNHIELYYNTEVNDMGGGEISRFAQQLLHESNLGIKQSILANSTKIEEVKSITIQKDAAVMQSLSRYLKTDIEQKKWLSPSAVNTYLECQLRFYFRYVTDLYEKNSLEDDVDSRSLGNVLHDAMEILYKDYVALKGSNKIQKEDILLLKRQLDNTIIKAFKKQFAIDLDREFYFEGKNIIAREIVKDLMSAILKRDAEYVPFEFIAAEGKYKFDLKLTDNKVAALKGAIDRVDKKDKNIRLIDYKTGKDTHNFKSIEELFDRNNKSRNKAAFQTFYYALVYRNELHKDEIMVPAVFNKSTMFGKSGFHLELKGTGLVLNAENYIDEYVNHLKSLLEEIYNPQIPFDQTEDEKKCDHCVYNKICNR